LLNIITIGLDTNYNNIFYAKYHGVTNSKHPVKICNYYDKTIAIIYKK
jgi:hypothetical protein